MAAKFKLVKDGTFTHPVSIPRAGEDDGIIKFKFKHMKTTDLSGLQEAFAKKITDLIDAADKETSPAGLEALQFPVMSAFILDIAEGWDLADEFSVENINTLFDGYPRAFEAITSAYQNELWSLRKKR